MSEASTATPPQVFPAGPDIKNWSHHLLPLLTPIRKNGTIASDPSIQGNPQFAKYIFQDAYGNMIDFLHTVMSLLNEHLLPFLAEEEEGSVEIPDMDRGRLYYTMQRYTGEGEGHGSWVVSQVQMDLNGDVGIYTQYVVVDELKPLVDFLVELALSVDE